MTFEMKLILEQLENGDRITFFYKDGTTSDWVFIQNRLVDIKSTIIFQGEEMSIDVANGEVYAETPKDGFIKWQYTEFDEKLASLLFEDNYNCYSDVKYIGGKTESMKAMTKDKFIAVIKTLIGKTK